MRNRSVRSCPKGMQAHGTAVPPRKAQGARTVFVKGHIILHEGLEVPALPHHELHGLLAVPQVVPGVPLQLVPQRPEQAVTAERERLDVSEAAEGIPGHRERGCAHSARFSKDMDAKERSFPVLPMAAAAAGTAGFE